MQLNRLVTSVANTGLRGRRTSELRDLHLSRLDC
jgi:hypothetical protein